MRVSSTFPAVRIATERSLPEAGSGAFGFQNCAREARWLHYRGPTRGARHLMQRPGAPCLSWLLTVMLEKLKAKLGAEAARLQYELNVTLPSEIRRAVEMGDLKENSEYKAALERQQFVQARLGQLHERLSKLAQVDLAQIPTDSVGLGSRVVVEDQRSGERETYKLVFGDAEEFEEGQVTMSSPIGRALIGKQIGDEVILRLPTMVRRLRLAELTTVHQLPAE